MVNKSPESSQDDRNVIIKSCGICNNSRPPYIYDRHDPISFSAAYVYSSIGQTIVPNGVVTFNGNNITGTAISHSIGFSSLNINENGTYILWYYVLGDIQNSFTIFRNGLPLSNSTFRTNPNTGVNNGMLLFKAFAGDILSLVNSRNSGTIHLTAETSHMYAYINASVIILKAA